MLRRKAMDNLLGWKSEPGHRCLLVGGQRGVGKTTLIREFAKTYGNSIWFDLSRDGDARRIFDGDPDVDGIVDAMRILRPGSTVSPGNTLIVLDEVQHCPGAWSALESFDVDGRYDVIAAGSFLDVPLGNEKGDVPTWCGNRLRMHGLDFEEFLWAVGYSEEQTAELRSSVRGREPLSDTALRVYRDRFAQFMMTGGLPEAVSAYASGEGIDRVSRILRNAAISFRNDAMNLAPGSEAVKILKCFDSVPAQLSGTNKKFMWSHVNRGGPGSESGARTYRSALQWAEGAGVVHRCGRLQGLEAPLSEGRHPSQFKEYMSDTGMLIALMGPDALYAAYSKDDSFARGALAENIVAECLRKAGVEPCYYLNRREPGRMELDFVAELGSETAAIEVGSGKDRSAPSLSKTAGDDRIQRRIAFGGSNIHTDENGIEHYPLFAAAFIKDMAEPPPEIELQRNC